MQFDILCILQTRMAIVKYGVKKENGYFFMDEENDRRKNRYNIDTIIPSCTSKAQKSIRIKWGGYRSNWEE